jgi:hypothetical protein
MSIVGGPVGTLLVALAAVIALVLWLRRDRSYPGPRLIDDDGIDREELEAAEREVRDLDSGARPEDGFLSDDWGPGASRAGTFMNWWADAR